MFDADAGGHCEWRYGEHLVHRAADVVLKERRRLVLVARETPLSEVHLENMLKLARMGVTIMPPMPAFYNHPKSIEQIVDHIVARVLDQFAIAAPFAKRWDGRMQNLPQKGSASQPSSWRAEQGLTLAAAARVRVRPTSVSI